MEVIQNLAELQQNMKTMDNYISNKTDPQYKYALNLVKRGICFVAVSTKEQIQFYPSRFIGYQENTMDKHKNNPYKDGTETNPAISKIIGTNPAENSELELSYREYCRALGFEPNDKGAFGGAHKYWLLKSTK